MHELHANTERQWVKEHFGVDLPATDYPAEAYPGYAAAIVIRSHQTGRVACASQGLVWFDSRSAVTYLRHRSGVTDLAVLEPSAQGLILKECAPGVSVEAVRAATAAPLIIRGDVPEMALTP